MADDASREYVRELLSFDRSSETVSGYEKMLFRLHTHVAPGEPYDAPSTWLSSSERVLAALQHHSSSTRRKHLSVVIELLRASGETELAAEYLDLRTACSA